MAEALLVVDKQNDFEAGNGRALGDMPGPDTTPYILAEVRAAVSAGQLVILSLDTHADGDAEFAWTGRHTVKGEWGWSLVEPLRLLVEGERRAGRVVEFPLGAGLEPETALLIETSRLMGKGMIALVEKETPDLFRGTVAAELLRAWRVSRVRITGQMAHLGLLYTAAGARFLHWEPTILARGVLGAPLARINTYLEDMSRCLGATIER